MDMMTINIMVLTGLASGFGVFMYMKSHAGTSAPKAISHHEHAGNTVTMSDEDDDDRFHLAPLGNQDEEYMNLFSNPPMDKPARRGKSAYLRDAYHERIRQIVNALNIEGVNISSYVDMVLTDHLMRYESQIDKLIQNCHNKGKKQWLPS